MEKLKLYKLLSNRFLENNEFELSEKYLKKSIEIILKKSLKSKYKDLTEFYYYLGFINFQLQIPDSANKYFQASVFYGTHYSNTSLINISTQYLADYFYNIGNYQKSLDYSVLGLKFSNFENDFGNINRLFYLKSKSFYQLNDFNNSVASIDSAIVYSKSNLEDLSFNYFFKASVLSSRDKNISEAEFFFRKSISLFKQLNDTVQLSNAYTNLGYLYYSKKKDYSKGLYYSFLGLRLSKNKIEKAALLNNIGKIYYLKDDYKNAIEYLEKSFSLYDSSEHENIKKRNFNPVVQKGYFYSLLQDKAICWLDYYKATKTKSHLAHALQTFELADKLVDFMRQEHTGTLSKYFWRDKTRSLYENAIETCLLLKDYEKAYYFMEKSRAVMLNDKLNELGAKQKLNEADQEKEREYQRKIIELNTKIEAETKAAAKEKLNSQLFDLQEQQERFVKSLETKYPAFYQLKYNTQIGTLKQMQAYLKTNFKDKNATMVSYFFGDSASYAMVISPNKSEIKQFKYDVAQNQEFVNILANNQGTKADYARILSMGSDIYQNLIKPLNIPKGLLIISQDGVFMPFEALSSSATSAQYLLKDYAISYTYSGQFLLKKQTETKFWPNQTFVGFAPIEFKNLLNTLKNSDITLGNVAKNYWFSDTFTGKGATKANFLHQAKDHKIVQIFTHAFADSVDTEPKIYFADQALKISELNAEDQFNTQLLVLSACKTGVGKLAKGEGVLSLARGFSMLGIPATVTSLWSVEDKNTYQLTELFYKFLNEGQSKDQALKKAKMEFLELYPNSSPSDWAGMVLVGETSELSNNSKVYWLIGWMVLLSIIGGTFYVRRKKLAA